MSIPTKPEILAFSNAILDSISVAGVGEEGLVGASLGRHAQVIEPLIEVTQVSPGNLTTDITGISVAVVALVGALVHMLGETAGMSDLEVIHEVRRFLDEAHTE